MVVVKSKGIIRPHYDRPLEIEVNANLEVHQSAPGQLSMVGEPEEIEDVLRSKKDLIRFAQDAVRGNPAEKLWDETPPPDLEGGDRFKEKHHRSGAIALGQRLEVGRGDFSVVGIDGVCDATGVRMVAPLQTPLQLKVQPLFLRRGRRVFVESLNEAMIELVLIPK